MSGDDEKPQDGDGEEVAAITLRIRDQSGEEMFFKIKQTTKMSKVFQTYAQRKGVAVNSLRFMLDGDRIDGEYTPKMLELDDHDQIDCVLEQTGGSSNNSIRNSSM